MADGGEEARLGDVGPLGSALRLVEGSRGLDPRGDVAAGAQRMRSVRVAVDRHLDEREPARHVVDREDAFLDLPNAVRPHRDVAALDDAELRRRPDQVERLPAEHRGEASVGEGDAAPRVALDDGLGRRLDQRPVALLALGEAPQPVLHRLAGIGFVRGRSAPTRKPQGTRDRDHGRAQAGRDPSRDHSCLPTRCRSPSKETRWAGMKNGLRKALKRPSPRSAEFA